MADRVKTARDIFAFRGQVSIEMLIRGLVAKSRQEALQREHDQESAKWSKVLKRLPRADAGYSASVHARHGRLLAGTRTDLLQELDDWATSAPTAPDQSPFFVLTGGAGTGKSTIAFDVARRAETRGHLGASFFFMRGAASLDSTELIFPTLAWQMLSNVPSLRSPEAYSVIETHLQRGGPQNMDQQAEDLFVKLLLTLPATHAPITIVVDAVDECSASTQDFVQRMLFLIMQSLSSITCTVRVFVTSRPEVHVEDALRSLTFQSKTQRFRLQDIPRPTVDHDIRLFFTNALSQLPEVSRLALSSVYGDAAGELTERAAGLFIYAATAAEYLRWFRGDDVLEAIAQILAADVDAAKPELHRLDDLYAIVLNTAFPAQFLALPGKAEIVNVVLGSIAVLQDHVSPEVLSVLAGLDLTGGILPVLERLAPVVSFDNKSPDVVMRPLHASFAEFLTGPAPTSAFRVDSSKQHRVFAGYALNLLLKRGTLVCNICRIEHPGDTPVAVTDLRERISLYLPLPVQYACLYWPVHAASVDPNDVPEQLLQRFCLSELFVFWLEALAYLSRLDIATQWLPSLRHMIADRNAPLAAVLKDGFHVVAEFAPAMQANPYQLYISALPFCPGQSPLRQYVHPFLPAVRIPYPRSTWSSWMATNLETAPSGRRALCVAKASPDSRWIAVISTHNGGRIHLCDPATSTIIRTITAQEDAVLHMDISSSGRAFVTVGSNGDIHITDSRSGSRLHSLLHVADAPSVHQVAFALRDTSVVLVSDSDIFLWDLRTDTRRLLPRIGVEGRETFPSPAGLTRSSDGFWAILISQGQVELLDLRLSQASLFLDAPGVCGAGFLSDDRVLLALAESLRVYDLPTGNLLHSVVPQNFSILAVSVSRNGRMVAVSGRSAERPGVIYVWDPSSGDEMTLLDYSWAEALSVTPTGSYIMAVLRNSSVCRAGDTRHIATAEPAESNFVLATAVSADLSTVAVVRALTLHTMAITVYSLLEGTEASLISIQRGSNDGPFKGISLSDDSRILIAVWSREIKLWRDSDWSEAFDPSCFDLCDQRNTEAPRFLLVAAAFSADGKLLFGIGTFPRSGRLDEDDTQHFGVAVWDVQTNTLLRAFTTSMGDVRVRDTPVRIIPTINTDDIHLVFQTYAWENIELVIRHEDWDVPLISNCPAYIPMSPLPHTPHVPFRLYRDGTVTRNTAPAVDELVQSPLQVLCWIPPSQRGNVAASSQVGPILVSASNSHEVTIIDLSAFLEPERVG